MFCEILTTAISQIKLNFSYYLNIYVHLAVLFPAKMVFEIFASGKKYKYLYQQLKFDLNRVFGILFIAEGCDVLGC